jgi:hypothetical protein
VLLLLLLLLLPLQLAAAELLLLVLSALVLAFALLPPVCIRTATKLASESVRHLHNLHDNSDKRALFVAKMSDCYIMMAGNCIQARRCL